MLSWINKQWQLEWQSTIHSLSADKLYVVMEYIEGAPLGEHFNSLKEKGLKFSEERIWKIYIQVINHCSWLPSTCLPFSVVCLPLLDVLSCMILNNKLKASMQLYLNINGHWKMKEMLITLQKKNNIFSMLGNFSADGPWLEVLTQGEAYCSQRSHTK